MATVGSGSVPFDPFDIDGSRAAIPKAPAVAPTASARYGSNTSKPRRPVLMAVDKRTSGKFHHSQLYSERHGSSTLSPDHSLGGRSTRSTTAGRLNSTQQQLAAARSGDSQDDALSVDPFGINPSTTTDNNNNNKNTSQFPDVSQLSLEPQTLEPRLDQAAVRPLSPPAMSRQMSSSKRLALPPKMTIKLTLYEEVSSMALQQELVASQIAVEGSAYAQVQCSDARKNAPFAISLAPRATNENQVVKLRPNPKFTSILPPEPTTVHMPQQLQPQHVVQIPKTELGYVPVVHYSFLQVVDHMPVLLERKVTIQDTSCRIALQVRSKLTNQGPLRDFTLAVAIPEAVDGESIQVVRGQGAYDPLKRLVKFQLAALEKGESFMVSAQAKLWNANLTGEDVRFPVLMRCSSTEDQISTVDFAIREADGTPCSISVTRAYSFRLLHRLT